MFLFWDKTEVQKNKMVPYFPSLSSAISQAHLPLFPSTIKMHVDDAKCVQTACPCV